MSIAELVPSWRALPDPSGAVIDGVSLRGRSYRLRSETGARLEAHGVLDARGFEGGRDVFLKPLLRRDTPDPMSLMDMGPAAARLAEAVRRRQRVVVFGDYDVDGAASSALIGRWLAGLGVDVSIYIPDRIAEGYGPTPQAMTRALASKPDLLVCVDCGTAAVEVLEAVECQVVVIDHHKQQGDLPIVSAVVNPHRLDDESGLGMLCATSLCFLVVVAAQGLLRDAGELPPAAPPVRDLLDLVALATVADVVPLVGPSRLFVAKGLEIMASGPCAGIAALMQVAGVSDASAGRIGFALGPRINAGGRVGGGSVDADGALGAKLLMSVDPVEALAIAQRLDALNRQRQEVEKACLDEAMSMAGGQVDAGRRIATVFGDGWHPGVVGIVAGRIRERHDLPALVGALVDGMIKGSGRSVAGFDLGAVIVEAKRRGLLETGGGHAMACGFGCRLDRWPDFEEFVRRHSRWDRRPEVVDMMVDAADVRLEGIASLTMLEPLGQGNPAVRVAVRGLRVRAAHQLKNGHVKLELGHAAGVIEGLWWRAGDDGFEDVLLGMSEVDVMAVGTPRVDEWRGRSRLSMDLVDLVPVA